MVDKNWANRMRYKNEFIWDLTHQLQSIFIYLISVRLNAMRAISPQEDCRVGKQHKTKVLRMGGLTRM